MFTERTTIGLDVHTRSVVAAALDTHTGELVTRRLTPDFTDITTFINTRLSGWPCSSLDQRYRSCRNTVLR